MTNLQAMALDGVDKSEVSRLCCPLDEVVGRFHNRPLENPCPYLWVGATYSKVRDDGRVASMAFVIAIGVEMTGEREILWFDLWPSEDEGVRLEFQRGLQPEGCLGYSRGSC